MARLPTVAVTDDVGDSFFEAKIDCKFNAFGDRVARSHIVDPRGNLSDLGETAAQQKPVKPRQPKQLRS